MSENAENLDTILDCPDDEDDCESKRISRKVISNWPQPNRKTPEELGNTAQIGRSGVSGNRKGVRVPVR